MNRCSKRMLKALRMIIIFVFILGMEISLSSRILNAIGLDISLTVKEHSGIDRINEPVTYGVPFSKDDNIISTSNLGIFDDTGFEIPAQFRVLSRYNSPVYNTDKPIRVVLVDFKADINASQERTYYLRNDGSGTTSGSNLVSEDADYVTINTGKLIAKINKNNFNLFDEVYVDGKKVVSSNPSDGIIINYQGKDYTSNNALTEIEIEENRPLRAVLKVRGYFEDSSGGKLYPPSGDVGLSYTVRFKVFKDKPYVKVDYTLENENKGWTRFKNEAVHNIFINSVYLKTTLNLNINKTVQFDNYQDSFTSANYKLLQDHQEITQDESGNFVYSIEKNGNNVENGARYDSFTDLRDAEKGLMVANRWFWQNWPKAVEVNDNVINYYLWPDMSYEHRILGGIYKTHELIYNFHSTDNDFDDELATLKKRLVARASGDYYAKTDFLGPMIPPSITSNYTFPAGESLQAALDKYDNNIKAKFDSSYSSSQAKETFFTLREKRPISNGNGPLNWYGWLWFGDTPRGSGTYGYSAQHYAWDYISLVNSLRFDDDNMFDIGEGFVSHKADIIIIHDPFGLDFPDEELIYHGAHRYEEDALMSFNDGYSTSLQSMVQRASHFWNKGLILQYLLTGDGRYYDAAIQTGFHLNYSFITIGKCDTQYCGEQQTRNQGRAVFSLVDIYRMTGDQLYLDAAYNVFVNGILSREGSIADETKEGYIDQAPYSFTKDDCGGLICDNQPHHDVISSEALVNLYYELKDNGRISEADNVKSFLERQANWAKNTLYKHWQTGEGGQYSADMKQYFPYVVKHEMNKNYKWPDGGWFDYSMRFADTFALLYRETGNISWLNLARNVFKDHHIYGTNGRWKTTIFSPSTGGKGFSSNPDSGYLKNGPTHGKPMFYLNTEWKESLGATLLGDINNDGIVDILDLQLCVNVFLGTETRPDFIQRAKQVAEPKDECNVLDVQGVVNIILNL